MISSNTIDNNKDDVYSRYKPLNDKWELRNPGSRSSRIKADVYGYRLNLHEYMFNTMIMHCVNINNYVKNEINKYSNITSPYYVRRFIKSNAFIIDKTVMEYPWIVDNYDPWGRQFPLFVNSVISNYYDKCDNKTRYGCCVFYNDRVSRVGLLIKNVVPQMILTTTSLDGVTVPCLDLIEA